MFDATLAPLLPFLPDALAPAAAKRALLETARVLPAMRPHVLFETRPGGAAPRSVDLSVHFPPGGFGPDFARAAGPLGAVVRRNDRADTPGGWLEFDVPASHPGPSPGVFVRFRDAPATQVLELVQRALPFLPGTGAATRDAAEKLLATVPDDATLVYVGLMASRRPPVVRFELHLPNPAAAIDLCRRLGWPGDHRAMEQALILAEAATQAMLAIDLTDQIQPQLGLEIQTGGVFRPTPATVLWRLLDRLTTAGLIGAAQRAALLEWPGYDEITLPGEPEPSVLFRTVNHVKLGIAATGGLEAKAYLLCRVRPSADVRAILSSA